MIPDELNKDIELLKEQGYVNEIVEESGRIYIVFKNYPLPDEVYNLLKTDLLIYTTPQYPNAGFDMFWVDETLTLKNKTLPQNGDSIEVYLGRRWRRFSYHPYNAKPWNPSEDNIVSYMSYVEQRLRRGN